MTELKTGIIGYKKGSVYNYIVSLEEEAARKMAKRDQEAEQAKQAYEKRVSELEQELEIAREEKAALSKKHMDEVEEYRESIRRLRESFLTLLSETTEKSEQIVAEMEYLQEKIPAKNKVLFPKSSQTKRQESEEWKKSSSM